VAAKSRNPRDFKDLLRGGRWFAAIPEAMQEALLGAATVERLVERQRLFARGDAPSGLYAVLEGVVRISGSTDEGRESLLLLAEPPSWFGEIAVFDGLPRTHDADADGAACVLHVPEAPLQGLLAREPRWWRELGLLASGKLRLALGAIEDMALHPAPVRLARRLLMMSEGYGEHREPRRVVEVRQDQLAALLSMSRQTANGVLKELEASGAVKPVYGGIEILDAAKLRAAAAFDT